MDGGKLNIRVNKQRPHGPLRLASVEECSLVAGLKLCGYINQAGWFEDLVTGLAWPLPNATLQHHHIGGVVARYPGNAKDVLTLPIIPIRNDRQLTIAGGVNQWGTGVSPWGKCIELGENSTGYAANAHFQAFGGGPFQSGWVSNNGFSLTTTNSNGDRDFVIFATAIQNTNGSGPQGTMWANEEGYRESASDSSEIFANGLTAGFDRLVFGDDLAASGLYGQVEIGWFVVWDRPIPNDFLQSYIDDPHQIVRPRWERNRAFLYAGGGVANLVIQGALHIHQADGVSLTQQHSLVAQDSAHAHTADALTLSQLHQLVIAEALHAHSADNLVLTTADDLTVQDGQHGHAADNLALTQLHQLVLQDAAHGHTAENVTLSVAGQLVIADGQHGHLADNISLTQLHQLLVADSVHAHSADNLDLTQLHQLVIQEAAHGHTGENIVLSIATALSIADALHGHTGDNVALTQLHGLVIQAAIHSHAADAIALTQQHSLIISDALHAMLSDVVTITDASIETPAGRTIVVESDGRTVIVAAESRTITVNAQ